MTGHGRPSCFHIAAVVAVLASCPAVKADGPVPVPEKAPWLRAMQEDAQLADVCFVDAEHGWAVGDRGVIWHTADGGRRWTLQKSGVTCRLESVCFLDAENGWAAGGFAHPYLHTHRGVLLRTRDGGQTWLEDQGLVLPALKRVKFLNGAAGWAFGEPSALFPSGLFATDDGGRSWMPLTGPVAGAAGGWLAGDFMDHLSGAVAGRSGLLGAVRRRGLTESQTASLGLPRPREIKLAGSGGWLVGDDGTLLTSGDFGRTWQGPPSDPTTVVGSQFDWRAVEVRGSHCWIAGSPGSRVLHSADGGRSWQAFATGHAAPIQALAFADERHGWAVGSLGAILATRDGGQTWQRQRSAGTRVALLALYSDPAAVPHEMIVRLCAQEGYLGAAVWLARRDQEAGAAGVATLDWRAHEALVALGASDTDSASAFPVRQAGLSLSADQLIEGWDRANGGDGVEKLEAYLVRQLRTWRPEVVVTHSAGRSNADPLEQLLSQVVLRAVEQAAGSASHPEHLSLMGLEPWQVKKVFGSLPPGELGQVNVTTAQLASLLGHSLADYAAESRGLIDSNHTAAPANWGFRLYVDHLPQGAGERDFFSGISLAPGTGARRAPGDYAPEATDLLRQIAQKQRTMQAILARADAGRQDQSRLLAQIGDLTAGLDDSSSGELLYQLAQHYHRSGQWQMAAETFGLLAGRQPRHPLAQPALVWLVQYWSSQEAAWRQARPERLRPQQMLSAAAAAERLPVFPPDGVPPLGQVLSRSAQASRGPGENPAAAAANPSDPATVRNARLARALAVGKLLEQAAPTTYAEPFVRFPLAVAERQLDDARQAPRYFAELDRQARYDAWRHGATAEQWFAGTRADAPPENLLRARFSARPVLDGLLDDELWRQAAPVELTSAQRDDADWSAVCLVAYDARFLYLAVDCRRAAGCRYLSSSGPRPRDPDLSANDRVDFFLDLDRDRATYYRFSIDHRGWTGEACWGDTTWDPTWYVAAREDGDRWTAEAAIPLDELTGSAPQAGDAWLLGIQRTVPGVGFQSWTHPASTSVLPEGFGYLLFEDAD